MSKKAIIGSILFVIAIAIFIFGALGTNADPQDMYRAYGDGAEDHMRILQELRSLCYIGGGSLGAVGLVLLLVGMLQKKPLE